MVAFSAILPNQLGYTLVSDDIRLRFIHVIGKGAYGIVYLAWDLSTPQRDPKFFAVKCTLKYEANTEFAELQQREILHHRSLSWHPNIASLHHVIEEEYYVYLVMDYLEGGDLHSAITQRNTFERNDEAVRLAFVQILDAVQACHDMGISHRDLKPENIFCSQKDSRFYIGDFGLSTQTCLSSSFGCGSSLYMSPECIGAMHGGSLQDALPYSTWRSDVWSLGIILVNMLTGRNPWQLANPHRDVGFTQYLTKRGFFLSCILPVSHDAAELLSSVLDPNPRTRIRLPELRRAVLEIRTFFPAPVDAAVPDYIRAADTSFRASLEHTIIAEPETHDDGELIIDVPFDLSESRHAASVAARSDVYDTISLGASHEHEHVSTFVNGGYSSWESDGTPPPATPTSPVSRIPTINPAFALVAEAEQVEMKHHRTLRRFMGAVRRVAIRA